jgi:hypothetical protein
MLQLVYLIITKTSLLVEKINNYLMKTSPRYLIVTTIIAVISLESITIAFKALMQ